MMHFREVRAHPFIHDLDLIQSFSSVSASPLTTKISQIQVTADLLLGKPSSTLPKISLDSCPAVFPQLTYGREACSAEVRFLSNIQPSTADHRVLVRGVLKRRTSAVDSSL